MLLGRDPLSETELREVLEADIAYRARRLRRSTASPGVRRPLAGGVALAEDQPQVYDGAGCRMDLGRRTRMLLVPSAFVEPTVMTESEAPSGARAHLPVERHGCAEWSPRARAPVDQAARRLIGQTRATILAAIETPTSTTAVAKRLGLSAGGVADHLKVLRDAGLAIRSRVGPEVQYRQTDLARELLRAPSV